jgi:hypothetical protein
LVVTVLIEFLEEPHLWQRPARAVRARTFRTTSAGRTSVGTSTVGAATFWSARRARSAARAVVSLIPRAPFVTVFPAIFARLGALFVV